MEAAGRNRSSLQAAERTLRWYFVGILLFLCTCDFASSRNVLIFSIDSCRSDRFGTYGYPKGTTPHIDEWAKKGTVFTQAYSTSSWTAPGLASILSGLYPPVHGINNRDRMGSPELATLPKILRKRGFRVPNLNFFTFAPYYRNLGLPEFDRKYFKKEETSPLLNWLKSNLTGSDEQPFFVWFHTTVVHQPYRPKPEDLPDTIENLEKSPGIKAVMNGAIVPAGSTLFSKSDRQVLDQLYDAEIRRVDRVFGEVLNYLEKQRLFEKTLIILTADHGEELLDHGFVGHASTSLKAKLYEELVRIPLVLSWPGVVAAGKSLDYPVSQIDILPTVASLLDFPIPAGVQGEDLFKPKPARPIFFESVIAGNQTPKERTNQWVRAIRKGRFKYISSGELYDLAADPGEYRNLVEDKPELAATLKNDIDDWLAEAKRLREELFSSRPDSLRTPKTSSCPNIYTPGNNTTLDYDVHTGALLFDWSGDMETTYLIEYDIATGDHHVSGVYEVDGNHQILGPFTRELWENLKAWNPFRIRVSPKVDPPCWSRWVEFRF